MLEMQDHIESAVVVLNSRMSLPHPRVFNVLGAGLRLTHKGTTLKSRTQTSGSHADYAAQRSF